MQIDIVTLFPEMFKGPFGESIVKRAVDKNLLKIRIHNLRKWAIDKRGTVDGRPYGGGPGMLLRPEPIFEAVEFLSPKLHTQGTRVPQLCKIILLDPAGKIYNQEMARQFAKIEHIILICGHYEGVDYRIHKYLADEVVSIGNYILTGGEIPAMVLVDSLTRLIPGVLEKKEATTYESFSSYVSPTSVLSCHKALKRKSNLRKEFLLEYPQYTRPEVFRGHCVPKILLSGNHAEIEKWRQNQALKRTRTARPGLLRKSFISPVSLV